MMWGWGSGGWISLVVMSLMMVVFWGGLVALTVWAIRSTVRRSEPSQGAESILEERFARGEIDAEELESRRTVLRGGGKQVA